MDIASTVGAEDLMSAIRENSIACGHEICRPATILLGDGLARNPAFGRIMNAGNAFRFLKADTAPQLMDMLDRTPVDLVIVPGARSKHPWLDCCRRIKAQRRTELLPVLVVTESGVESQIEALGAGADDFLPEPVHTDLALARIRTLLRQKATVDRLEQTEVILFSLARAVEHRDQTTGSHCDRLGLLSLALGVAVGLGQDDLQALYRGGYLHDIGKVGIPDRILYKPGPLDEEEWEIMRTHPLRGEDICKPLRSLERVLPIIRNHHERWDGSGYPDGLKGKNIPLLARILQFADIYDALTNSRPYKKAISHDEALTIMLGETEQGWRDPELMRIFAEMHREPADNGPWREAHAMQNSLRNLQSHLLAS